MHIVHVYFYGLRMCEFAIVGSICAHIPQPIARVHIARGYVCFRWDHFSVLFTLLELKTRLVLGMFMCPYVCVYISAGT